MVEDEEGLFAVPTLVDDEPASVCWSYGMGADSTAGIVRTILDPQFRHPCLRSDLSNLTLVTAQTGDEFPALAALLERHVLPLLRANNIRLVEVARAGPRNEDGIVVLQDTRHPERMHFSAAEHGFYALSNENRDNGIMPQRSGKRKCTLKFKGWPMDHWRRSEFGSQPYFHAIGYNAEEARRIADDEVLDLGGQRHMIYPLYDAGMTRQDCLDYLFDLFGVLWPKSLCRQCCFVSKHEWPQQLSRLIADPVASARHVVDEFVTLALNARSGLFGPEMTLTDRLRDAQAHEILHRAETQILYAPWALYRVRRVYFAPAVAWRSVDTAYRGTAGDTRDALAWLAATLQIAPVTDRHGHTRVWLAHRPQAPAPYPQVESFFVAAPAHVLDKQQPGFEKHWMSHTSDELRELDMDAADHLHRRLARPVTGGRVPSTV
ncbi:hypothetical protein C5E45_20630 [Nocardia nova]|uniref:Uncharacterized protein n=1 Tax=Nocardia nova TaxID=37330 RepID=A0A2S6AMM5_9NOCA|nr:hypothetical protein [Nocardia nova]PPJ36453.1 hypothetical protein C5E45_20630 [Nocardia nova]